MFKDETNTQDPICFEGCQTTLNPSCTKVFGTHTFYEGGGGGGGWWLSRPSYDLENGRLYKLQLWQAIITIYER